MKQISRSKILEKQRCRGYYQVGNAYCPVGAFLSEYLGRDDLSIIQHDCFFDAPEDVMSALMEVARLTSEGLKKYTVVADSGEDFTKNWLDSLGALLWDAQQKRMIELLD